MGTRCLSALSSSPPASSVCVVHRYNENSCLLPQDIATHIDTSTSTTASTPETTLPSKPAVDDAVIGSPASTTPEGKEAHSWGFWPFFFLFAFAVAFGAAFWWFGGLQRVRRLVSRQGHSQYRMVSDRDLEK